MLSQIYSFVKEFKQVVDDEYVIKGEIGSQSNWNICGGRPVFKWVANPGLSAHNFLSPSCREPKRHVPAA